jgi:hypothetical protein
LEGTGDPDGAAWRVDTVISLLPPSITGWRPFNYRSVL